MGQERVLPRILRKKTLAFLQGRLYLAFYSNWGRTGFDGDVEAGVAGRGAAGLVKSGKNSNCQRRQLRLRLRCLKQCEPHG